MEVSPRSLRAMFWGLTGWGLIAAGSPSANADHPARLHLTRLQQDTQILFWNESGEYPLTLPQGWTCPGSLEVPTRLLLASGEQLSLAEEGRVRVTYRVPAMLQAAALDLRVDFPLRLSCRTRSLEFPPGTLLEVDRGAADVSSEKRQNSAVAESLEVVRMDFREPREVAVEIDSTWGYTCDRCEVRALPGPHSVAAESGWIERGPSREGSGNGTPFLPEMEEVVQLSLWSAQGLRIHLQRGRRSWNLEGQTADLQWGWINGQTLCPPLVFIEAPGGILTLHRWFPWSSVRRSLRVELQEAGGQIAEEVVLSALQTPEWLHFSQIDSPTYLREQLHLYAQKRADQVGAAVDLPRLFEEYLLPLWFGIWYDGNTNSEVVKADPALPQFQERLEVEEAEAAALLRRWCRRWKEGRNTPGSSERLRESLDEFVSAVRLGRNLENRQHPEVWLSLYLGELLSAASGGAYHYWYPQRGIVGRLPPGKRPPTEEDLVAYLEQGRPSPLQQYLVAARKSARPTDQLHFARLLPHERRTVQVWVNLPPQALPGRYEARLRVGTAASSISPKKEQEVPITIDVKSDYLTQSGALLLQLLPAILVILTGTGVLLGIERKRRHRQAQVDHWRTILQKHYAEFMNYRWEHLDFLQGHAPDPVEAAQAALDDFLARALHEMLPPRLFGEFTALYEARADPPSTRRAAQVQEFFQERVTRYVQHPQQFV